MPATGEHDELRRLARLQMLGILDSQPEPVFDGLVRLAAQICGTPISLVSLVDAQRQWFKANVGLDGVRETPREVAFCAHAIGGEELLEVPDAGLDARFAGNPLVAGEPHIRFYAGAPIVMPGGERIGTLCVIDRQARRLTQAQRQALLGLAAVARDALLQREELRTARLEADEKSFASTVEAAPGGLLLADTEGNLVRVNAAWRAIFGVGERDALGRDWLDRVHPDDRASVVADWAEAVRRYQPWEREFRVLRAGTCVQVRCALQPLPAGEGRRGFVGIAADVSQRARAEARLREANRFLERAEQISGVGGWEIELPAQRVQWTDQVRRIHELPPGHVPDINDHFDYLEWEDRPRLRAAHAQALAAGTPWDLTLRLRTARARAIWVRSVGRVESDAQGRPLRLVGTVQDVSSQRAREESLRAANDLFQAVLDNLPCGLSVFDADMRLIAHNAGLRQLLDLPDRLFGPDTSFASLARFNALRGEYGPGDPGALVAQATARARQPRAHQFQRVRPDGTVIEVRGAPMPGGGLVATYVDVTAGRKAEEALRTSEERQKRALEASGLVLWDVDLATGRLYLSDNWTAMVGAQDPSPTLAGLFERVPETQRVQVRAALRAVLKGEKDDYDVEHQVRAEDGRLVWLHSRGQVTLRDAGGRALRMSGTNADITARRAAEAALREAKDAAEAANRAKTQFVTTISHEIRTPLNGVLGITRLLLARDIDATQRRLVELLDTSGQALMELVDDVLDFGKIEAGRVELEVVDHDLQALLNDLGDLYSLRASAKGLRFRLAADPGLPRDVRGDAHRLRQVLNNLLSNALKFTEEGGFSLEAEPAGPAGADGVREVLFRVRDSGIGIPPEAQPRLFERFVQADSSTTRRYGGSGLGLAIARELCERMGGSIALRSAPGAGSEFTVRLPLKLAAPPREPVPSGLHRQPAGGAALLVAEDNPTNQVVVLGLLAQAGWDDVVLVTDGQQALRAVAERGFAAVLMDCHMPGLDGFEAARRMRAQGLRMPIIALTAGVTDAERRKCLNHGMNDVLPKPLDPDKLCRTLQRWLVRPGDAPARFGGQALRFDRDGVLQRLGGDAELLAAAIGAFLDGWPALRERMQAALAQDDLPGLRRELHSLLGSAEAVGAVQVAGGARQLQERLRRDAAALMPEDVARLDREVANYAQDCAA